MRKRMLLCLLTGCLAGAAAHAQMTMDHPGMTMPAVGPDTREILKLSPEAVAGLRADMRVMMAGLGNVLELLAAGKRAEAAKTLEEELGLSAMSTHAGMMRASKEMPDAARMLGMGLHQAATELARNLKDAQPEAVFSGLSGVVGSCTACHMTYRVR